MTLFSLLKQMPLIGIIEAINVGQITLNVLKSGIKWS